MQLTLMRALTLAVSFVILFSERFPLSADDGIATNAYEFFTKYKCISCHDEEQQVDDFRLDDSDGLVRKPNPNGGPSYVDSSAPEESKIWLRVIEQKNMPPTGKIDDIESAKKLLTEWMKKGAPVYRPQEKRPHLSARELLTVMRTDLNAVNRNDRQFIRYFTLQNLHNNSAIGTKQLELTRAALSKLLNSLSWEPEIKLPEKVDPQGTILRIDLRWYGWSLAKWAALLQRYPYGTAHFDDRDQRELEEDIDRLAGDVSPYMRADWFIATASRAPLYDALLGLPETIGQLEKDMLGVNYLKNFDSNLIIRAGVLSSGVSQHNRVIERHPSRYGGYWRSFDFASSDQLQNIIVYPLGPLDAAGQFQSRAFKHVGGELIFDLPNGLHGYMLADAQDHRLKAPAPISIVRDLKESVGTPEVVNGLSCFSCHDQGMRTDFADGVGGNPTDFGSIREKVALLYNGAKAKAVAAKDRDRYLSRLNEAASNFTTDKLSEDPIAQVARLYQRDLTLEAVACELQLDSIEELSIKIKGSEKLRRLGLLPLCFEQRLKRATWERAGTSLFHQVAFEFGLSQKK